MLLLSNSGVSTKMSQHKQNDSSSFQYLII